MINYNSKSLFKSKEFNKNFTALFDESGPLYYILREYPNIPAKGGTLFPQYKDTTYFVHVLNTVYIGGIMLENNLLSRNVNIEKYSHYIKLFFASGIYHDFNKLAGQGIWKKEDYAKLIIDKRQILIKMLSGYFENKDMDEILNQINYIILSVENQGKDFTNTINIEHKNELNLISDYINKGDSISSILSQYKDESYILNKVLEKLSDLPNLKVIRFHKIHQTLLRNMIIGYTEDFFKDDIIIKSSDWMIINKQYNENDLKEYLKSKLRNEFNNVDRIINKYSPSGNSVDLTFYKEALIDKNFLEKYMDMHRESLLLYQKFSDLNNKYNLKDIFNIWGFDTLTDGRIKYYMATDEDEDRDILIKSLLVKIAILRRMEIELLEKGFHKELEFNEETNLLMQKNINIKKIDKITRKTLFAIAYAYLNKEKIEEIYDKTVNRLIKLFNELHDKNNQNNQDDVYKRLIDSIFLYSLEIKNEVQSKENICIQCGSYYNNEKINRINSFGIKATAGTGLKVSVLEYDLYDGKICELCRLENLVRQQQFKTATPLCIQIYTGDYMPNIDTVKILKTLALSLNANNDSLRIDDMNYNVDLGGKVRIPIINHHNLYFIERPQESKPNKTTIMEFNLLFNIIKFIKKSGFKIKLSSMFISGGTFYYTFKWESSPAWIKELKLDELRIDQIDSAVYILNLINKIAKLGRGEKDLPQVISSIMQEKMNIYTQIWNKISNNKNINFQIKIFLFENEENNESILKKYEEMFKMEEKKTKVEELAIIACDIDSKAPKTNNDNTWIIRTAMDVYERNRLDKAGKINRNLKDLQQKIGGELFDTATRRNNYSSKKLENACIDFGNKFVDFIYNEYGDMPNQQIKRDIISQFGLLYNIHKWENITKSSKEKKEVE